MKRITFSCLAAVILLQLIPVNGNARDIRNQKEKNNRTEIKQDTISAIHSAIRPGKDIPGTASSSPKKEGEEGERNVIKGAKSFSITEAFKKPSIPSSAPRRKASSVIAILFASIPIIVI